MEKYLISKLREFYEFAFSNSRELESILKCMRWGCKEWNSLMFSPSCENIAKAKLLAEYLFLVIQIILLFSFSNFMYYSRLNVLLKRTNHWKL